MPRNISKFHFYMYQLRETYRRNMQGDTFDLSLLAIYGNFLKKYVDNHEFHLYYSKHIKLFPNKIEYAIVFLILIDLIGIEKIKKLDFEIIEGIVTSFIITRTNPHNFATCVKTFMDESLLDKMFCLWCISRIPLYNYYANIIKKYDTSTIDSYHNRAEILRYICDLTSTRFSPILKGYASLSGIKKVLYEEMRTSENDACEIEVLELLDEIDTNCSPEQKDLLVEDLHSIEVACATKEKAISLMLQRIRSFQKSKDNRIIKFVPIQDSKTDSIPN